MNTEGRIVVLGTRAVYESQYLEEMPATQYDSAALRRIAETLQKFADQIDHINVALNPQAKSVLDDSDIPF